MCDGDDYELLLESATRDGDEDEDEDEDDVTGNAGMDGITICHNIIQSRL